MQHLLCPRSKRSGSGLGPSHLTAPGWPSRVSRLSPHTHRHPTRPSLTDRPRHSRLSSHANTRRAPAPGWPRPPSVSTLQVHQALTVTKRRLQSCHPLHVCAETPRTALAATTTAQQGLSAPAHHRTTRTLPPPQPFRTRSSSQNRNGGASHLTERDGTRKERSGGGKEGKRVGDLLPAHQQGSGSLPLCLPRAGGRRWQAQGERPLDLPPAGDARRVLCSIQPWLLCRATESPPCPHPLPALGCPPWVNI